MKHVLRERRWLYRGVFVYAALVAVATVYGRYHFAVDALAGMVVGAAAAALGAALLGSGRFSGQAAAACESKA